MALQIPVYEAGATRSGLPDLPSVNLPRGTIGVPEAQGVANIGAVVNEFALKKRREADFIAVTAAETRLNSWTQDTLYHPKIGVTNRKGRDAFGLPGVVLPEYDKEAEKITQELYTEEQRLAFWEIKGKKRVQLDAELNKHESVERENFYDETAASALKDSVRSAGNMYNDPLAIKSELQRQIKVLANQADRKGWSPEQLDEAVKDAHSLTHVEVIERMMAIGQKSMARSYFEVTRDQLRGDHATAIEKMFRVDDDSMKESLRLQHQDLEAAARQGVVINRIPPREMYVSAFGEDAGSRLYSQAQGFVVVSRDVAALNDMPADQLGETLMNYEPSQVEGAAAASEREAILAGATSEIITQREKNAAGYLVSTNQIIQDAWNELQANGNPEALQVYMSLVESERHRLGIINKDVLPDSYANQIVADITVPKDNETIYGLVNNEAARWGRYWPKVQGQVASKLPDSVAVISSGIPPQAGIALSSMASLKASELRGLVPNGVTWEDLETKVKDKFGSFLRTFPGDAGGTRTANAIEDSAIRLALYYSRTGSNLNDAVDIAYTALGAGKDSQYQMSEVNSVPFRFPAGLSPDLLEAATDPNLIELPPDTLLGQFAEGTSDEDRLEWFNDHVKESGYWVASPDADGLLLYVDGAPVTRGSERNPVKIKLTWMELAKIGERRGVTEARKGKLLREAQADAATR